MSKILSRFQQVASIHGGMFLPLCFVFPGLVNIAFFYLGLAYQDNPARKLGFILFNCLFAVICLLILLENLTRKQISRPSWLLLEAVALFFTLSYAVGFFKFGLNSNWLHNAEQFIVFSVPAFFMGIYGALNKGEKSFFPYLESVSLFVFPFALIYANGSLFACLPWNYGRNLGILNYMTIAYALMPFLFAHMVCFADRRDIWTVPFIGRPIPRPQLVRSCIIALYWTTIICTVTRGTYVCVIVFSILLAAAKLLQRSPAAKRTLILSLAIVGSLCFNLFVYSPLSDHAFERVNVFLDGLSEGALVTSYEDPSVLERIDEMVAADGGKQIVNLPNPEDPNAFEEDALGTLKIRDRGTLYKLAFQEFLKSPLFGMGPGGYTVKYGEYPHNVILELLCETGLFVTLLFMAVLFFAIVKLVVISFPQKRKNSEIQALLVFFLTFAVQANISGTIWACPALLCALGYALALPTSEYKMAD